jgi:hypothetical protein
MWKVAQDNMVLDQMKAVNYDMQKEGSQSCTLGCQGGKRKKKRAQFNTAQRFDLA